jgi:serine protease AprX
LLLLATLLQAQEHPKLAPELKGLHNEANVDVIVQFRNTPHNESRVMRQKIAAHGARLQHDFSFMHAMHASLPSSRLAELERDGEVVYVSPNRRTSSLLNNSAGAVNASYAASLGLNGSGIAVGVIDSGIQKINDLSTASLLAGLPGLATRVVASFDFVGGNGSDAFGHGTHVAGIIGGNATQSSCLTCTTKFRGIAPGVSLVNLRALDKNGVGSDATVIAAINQAIASKATYNLRVINLSLGRPVFESYTQDPLCQAVEAAWQAGIVVVVAAGNDGRDNSFGTNGYGTITAPGNDPYVITVGAMNAMGTPTRSDDIMTTYSSKGPTTTS